MRLLFLLLFAVACKGSTPLTKFTVVASDADESCTKLLDYCLRMTCSVRNDGAIPGQAVIDMVLTDGAGGRLHTQTERVQMGPGDTRTVTHDFTEAKILAKDYKVACVVR